MRKFSELRAKMEPGSQAKSERLATEMLSVMDSAELCRTQKGLGRFAGCLLGGAVGDALGAAVEFMGREEILRRFGPAGLTAYAPAYGGRGRITDDTQMTLFTAEGLLQSWTDDEPPVESLARAYLRWLKTQDEEPARNPEGVLLKVPELYARRAPGATCLSALKHLSAKRFLDRHLVAGNDSKGCGGVMRVAPVGLYAFSRGDFRPHDTFQLAAQAAAITHGHPTGFLAAGALAVMIQALAGGLSLKKAVGVARDCLVAEAEHEETLRAINAAEQLAAADLPPEEAVSRLGLGWVAEEALAIALYCALKAKTFRQGVLMAVNHDGDSDSTGSIAGNLLGAWRGLGSVPKPWLKDLELVQVIGDMAEDLFRFPITRAEGYSRHQ